MIDRYLPAALVAAFLLLFSPPVSAKWYEASSENFVIYADDSERDIKRYAENLERYHSAMEYVTRWETEAPSPSNRVVIFVVGSERKVQKMMGKGARNVAGFYIPRAGASRAFVQTIRNQNGYPHFSTTVLLHEYAHHFLISSSRFEMPKWMSEGAAEFFSAASFDKDGSVRIGRPAQHRAGDLFYADKVSVRELLDYELYQKNRGRGFDAFYGRSWLLYHYLTFEAERRGQLSKYWVATLNAEDPIAAGEKAFGDLDKLEKDLAAYQRRRRMFSYELSPEKLNASPVSLRLLPEGEAKMMKVRMRSQKGVNREQAEELVIEAREIAAEYPNDPGVLSALAEAEYDAGNDDAAIAAADRAIAIDPKRTNPYVQKGYALFRKAEDAEDSDAAYKAAMVPFSQLNKLENNHPLPLLYYYRSFAERGITPPENARHAIERAAQLAPFDHQLWFQVGMLQMEEGKIALAKASLKPIASNPHGGSAAQRTKTLIALLDNMTEGEPVNMQMVREIDTVTRTMNPEPLGGDGGSARGGDGGGDDD